MALIICDKCGRQISNKATHCVGCGVAISDITASVESLKTSGPEEYVSNESLVGSSKNKHAVNFPTPLKVFSYLTFTIAFLHIVFTFFAARSMYPDAIFITLYSYGIFITPKMITLLIAVFIIAISLLTIKTRNTILRISSAASYLTLSVGSFQVFTSVSMFGTVWQWSEDAPRIPQAPFALVMATLQLLCLVLLLLPASSKYFNQAENFKG
jgi:hypothetical protein